MKYVKIKLDQLPRIMYSHECTISSINGKKRKNIYCELTLVKSGELIVSSDSFGNCRISEGMFLFVPSNVEYEVGLKGNLNHSCVAFFIEDCDVCDESDIYFEKIDNKEKTIIIII